MLHTAETTDKEDSCALPREAAGLVLILVLGVGGKRHVGIETPICCSKG